MFVTRGWFIPGIALLVACNTSTTLPDSVERSTTPDSAEAVEATAQATTSAIACPDCSASTACSASCVLGNGDSSSCAAAGSLCSPGFQTRGPVNGIGVNWAFRHG
jgi:hypothetical protein